MSEPLIVSLDEFAELCGVTSETMRVHLREVGRDGSAVPAWLVERGDRGRAYKIEAAGGVQWWREKREAEEASNAGRQEQLELLRREVVGDVVEPAALSLSGKQRLTEYAAAEAALKYRRLLGQLVEKDAVTRVISAAAVAHRRRLKGIAPEFGIAAGLPADKVAVLERMIERAVNEFVDEIEAADAFAE